MSKYKAQEAYVDKMHRQGCVKISTWVPEDMRDELLDIAEDMRRENLAALQKMRANTTGARPHG